MTRDPLAALFGKSLLGSSGSARRTPLGAELRGDEGLAAGDIIGGRYRVLDVKQGGLGRVYICEQLGESYSRGNSRCALKTPIPSLLRDAEVLERFIDEAVNWISLPPHPNTVVAYGLEMHARLPYIVMEYVGGGTLMDVIAGGGHGWQFALRAGLGIARSLHNAQATGRLSHGDLKPPNVLMTPSGAAKTTDFGFSKSLLTGRGVPQGWRVGTPGYMAPEMFEDAPMPAQASDIYAFGVTLYQSASAHWPVHPEERPGRRVDPMQLRSLVPDMPADLADLITACLAADVRDRPPTFETIVERLEMIHFGVTGAPPATDAAPDLPSPAEALRNAAQSWLNVGEWNKARGLAEQAIAQDEGNWRAHNALGLVHREAGEHEQARRCFVAAHTCGADELPPLVNAAMSAHDLGLRDEAGRWLLMALNVTQLTGEWSQLDAASSVIVQLMAADEALELLDRVLAVNPRAAVTWNNRAILLRRAGRTVEALESATRAIAVNPVYARPGPIARMRRSSYGGGMTRWRRRNRRSHSIRC